MDKADPPEKKKGHSHTTFDGKIFKVPDKDYGKFIDLYVADLKADVKHFVVEKKKRLFRYFIDLDVADDTYWEKGRILEVCQRIVGIVAEFFTDSPVCIVTTAPEKRKKGRIHTGIHLVWPKIIVDGKTALYLRDCILQRFEGDGGCEGSQQCEAEAPHRITSEIFDHRVYHETGFRLVGSDKCDRRGRNCEDRVYSLLEVLDPNGPRGAYRDRLEGSLLDLVQETSLRYIIDPRASELRTPPWVRMDAVILRQAEGGSGGGVRIKGTGTSTTILNGDLERRIVEQLVTAFGVQHYNPSIIKRIIRYEDTNILVQTSSRYCLNVGREHNSCGVYFHINRAHLGICQKCLCTCDSLEGRKKGYCRDYSSHYVTVGQDLMMVLFPPVQFLEDTPAPSEMDRGGGREEGAMKAPPKKKIAAPRRNYTPGAKGMAADRARLEKDAGVMMLLLDKLGKGA